MKLIVTFKPVSGRFSIKKSPLLRTMVPPSRLSPRSAFTVTVANSAGLLVLASITLPYTLPIAGIGPRPPGRLPAGGWAVAE